MGELEEYERAQSLYILAQDGEYAKLAKLKEQRGDHTMVIEFTTPRCPQCPLALREFNEISRKCPFALFVACSLGFGSDEADEKAIASQMLGEFAPNCIPVYMNAEQKELAKKYFGFSSVPFTVVLSRNTTEFKDLHLDDNLVKMVTTLASENQSL